MDIVTATAATTLANVATNVISTATNTAINQIVDTIVEKPLPETPKKVTVTNIENRRQKSEDILQAIYLSSQSWDRKPQCKEELAIVNSNEYVIISEYRHTISIQNEDITKKFVDEMIIKQNNIFEYRNKGKVINDVKKKKSLFSRK